MRGKLILEKVPGKVRETFMLLKVLGGCVKNKCWKTNVGKSWSYCGDLIWCIDAISVLWCMLAKCRDLRTLTNLDEMLRFTRFDACWQNVAIYALCQAQNVGCQALSTILYPCQAHPTLPLQCVFLPTQSCCCSLQVDFQVCAEFFGQFNTHLSCHKVIQW